MDNITISRNFIDKENSPKVVDSVNLNTLESITIKKIDEEEKKRFMELEQEEKRLNDLENEKIKLIEEEKEIRQKIMEEIERQEKKEREEKKKLMKLRYVESMKKKKEDEEKLRKIRLKQEMELKEINELKNKKKLQEEKLLLLMKGKLNIQEIKNYRKTMNEEKENNNRIQNEAGATFEAVRDFGHNKNKSERDFKKKYETMINDNNINADNEQILKIKKNKKNVIIQGIKSYQGINNNYINYDINGNNLNTLNEINNQNKYLLPKENMITINTIKNKTINSTNNIENNINANDYISFSPSIIPKKNIIINSPPTDKDINNIQTDLDQLIAFSPGLNNKKDIINDFLINNNNQNNLRNFNNDDENNLYEKKLKKNIKRKKSENNLKNISYEKKNIKEKLISNKTKPELIGENILKKEENKTKIINEIDINMKEQILHKAKSSSKINPYLKYSNNTLYQSNFNNYSSKAVNENNVENKAKNFLKETNKELLNSRNDKYIYNKEEIIIKQKSFMEDFILPKEIKKECLVELNKDKKEKKDNKDYGMLNFRPGDTNDTKYLNNKQYGNNRSKNKKNRNIVRNQEINGKVEENKNYSGTKPKIYYKEYINASERSNYNEVNENYLGDQNNSKFLMYYNEIYGDNKK